MKKAFTLIELLVVIVILGVLASLITGNFFTSLKKGRDAKRKADLEQIQRALELFYEDKRTYPTFNIYANANKKLCETSSCLASEKVYMQKVPTDSKTGNYGYETDAGGTYYRLNACLESSLQLLPYISTPASGFSCTNTCRNPDDTSDVTCIWGVTSTNVSP